MAKQEGILPIRGTIGNLTFFKSQDGFMVKAKSSIAKERIETDEAFARTRENMAEFSRAGKGAKLVRVALRNSLSKTKDRLMVSRLTTNMLLVVQADAKSDRGQRNVIDGEASLLQGFDFNIKAKLSATLFAPYTVQFDRKTGTSSVTIGSFVPSVLSVAPQGSTHFQLFCATAAVDFEAETFEVVSASSGELPYDLIPTGELVLDTSIGANSTHPVVVILGIEFLQQINGKFYSLKNGTYNACAVVNVDSPI